MHNLLQTDAVTPLQMQCGDLGSVHLISRS